MLELNVINADLANKIKAILNPLAPDIQVINQRYISQYIEEGADDTVVVGKEYLKSPRVIFNLESNNDSQYWYYFPEDIVSSPDINVNVKRIARLEYMISVVSEEMQDISYDLVSLLQDFFNNPYVPKFDNYETVVRNVTNIKSYSIFQQDKNIQINLLRVSFDIDNDNIFKTDTAKEVEGTIKYTDGTEYPFKV